MKIHHQVVVFDAADLSAESTFWAGVLDGTVAIEEDWHLVSVDGVAKVGCSSHPSISGRNGASCPPDLGPRRPALVRAPAAGVGTVIR